MKIIPAEVYGFLEILGSICDELTPVTPRLVLKNWRHFPDRESPVSSRENKYNDTCHELFLVELEDRTYAVLSGECCSCGEWGCGHKVAMSRFPSLAQVILPTICTFCSQKIEKWTDQEADFKVSNDWIKNELASFFNALPKS